MSNCCSGGGGGGSGGGIYINTKLVCWDRIYYADGGNGAELLAARRRKNRSLLYSQIF